MGPTWGAQDFNAYVINITRKNQAGGEGKTGDKDRER